MEPCRKKRRTMSSSSSAAPITSDWSSLPRDLLMVMAEFILRASVEDFMAFGGVCRSWRAVGRDDEFVKSIKLSWPRVPFLMLPEKEDEDRNSEEREFYSLSRRQIFMRFPVPEAKGYRCVESRFGWLVILSCSPQNEGDVELLNPFTASRIPLPNFKTFPNFMEYKHDPDRKCPTFNFIIRSALSANPSHTSDFVLMVVLATVYMAFWRNGDTHWTKINSNYGPFLDVNYSNRDHCFYALNTGCAIFRWDAAGPDPTILKMIHKLGKYIVRLYRWGAYLVESSAGELLLVARNGQLIHDFKKLTYGATEFRVYQVDVTTGECKRVWSLKGDAIFLGHNAAISIKVQPNDAIIKPNHIYFSDDSIYSYNIRSPYSVKYFTSDSDSDDEEEDGGGVGSMYPDEWDAGNFDARGGGGKDMGIYNLEDGSIQRFDHPHVESLSFICPSLWIAPSSFSWRLR